MKGRRGGLSVLHEDFAKLTSMMTESQAGMETFPHSLPGKGESQPCVQPIVPEQRLESADKILVVLSPPLTMCSPGHSPSVDPQAQI